jgi:hypothetical protein
MVRKMNVRGDQYPIRFGGQMDSGEIEDDQEEYMASLWEEMLKTRDPLKA